MAVSAKGISSVKYEQVLTLPGKLAVGSAALSTQKVWVKGNKMRMEMSVLGLESITIVNQDIQTMYIYMPAQNQAMKMPLPQGEAVKPESSSATELAKSLAEQKPVVVGSETIDGKACLIIEINTPQGKVKAWLWKEYGFPLRWETETTEGIMRLEWKNIEFISIPDSMFELPSGVTITEVPRP